MTTQKPPSWESQTTPQISQVTLPPCHGNDFLADPKNCNQYYLCNQGKWNYTAIKDSIKFDNLKVTTVYKSVLAVFIGTKAIAIGQKMQHVILMGPQRKKKRHFHQAL